MELFGFKNEAELDRAIAKQVVSLVRHSEYETQEFRKRWQLAYNLFDGKWDPGAERTAEAWQSRIFWHEFGPLVRQAASAMQNLIFERPDWYTLVPADDPDHEFTRISDKCVRFYLEKMDVENRFYEYALAGGVTGLAIAKITICPKVVYKPEVVIEQITSQQKADLRSASGSIDKGLPEDPSQDPDVLQQQLQQSADEIYALMMGSRKPRRTGPGFVSKKKIEVYPDLGIVDPNHFFWDPDAKDLNDSWWHCERMHKFVHTFDELFDSGSLDKRKRAELRKLADQTDPSATPVTVSSTYEGEKIVKQDLAPNRNEYCQPVEVLEYFGPLLRKDEKDGKYRVVAENMHFVVAGGKAVVKKQRNPYYNQKSPYVIATFSRAPFKGIGAGIADAAIDTQLCINDVGNLWIDLIRRAVYGIQAANIDGLEDPSQIDEGLVPGEVIRILGSKKPAEVLYELPANVALAGPLFQTLETLRLTGERAASVDVTSGNPASRARISATEVDSNVNRSTRTALSLGREIDTNFIEPVVARTLALFLQFGLERDSLQNFRQYGVLSDSEYGLLANIPPIERYNELNRNYKIKIKGFRERIDRDDKLQRINEFLTTLAQAFPPGTADINRQELLQEIATYYGFDTDKLFPQETPQDKAREENRILQNDQGITVGMQDQDGAELPVHYDQAMRTPNNSVLSHIKGHIQRQMQRGEAFPPPPPQIAEALGLPPPNLNGNRAGAQ